MGVRYMIMAANMPENLYTLTIAMPSVNYVNDNQSLAFASIGKLNDYKPLFKYLKQCNDF